MKNRVLSMGVDVSHVHNHPNMKGYAPYAYANSDAVKNPK
jgi:hypothetical protein